jgi:transcriptional regulator with XRE-family HTH domain
MARAAGVTQPAISKYLSGRTKPRNEVLFKIALAAGVSFDWLESGTGNLEPPPDSAAAKSSSGINTVHELIRQLGGIDATIDILTRATKNMTGADNRGKFDSAETLAIKHVWALEDAPPIDFTERFNKFIKTHGVEAISAKTNLSIERIEALGKGASPTFLELQSLVANYVISIDWLLVGDVSHRASRRMEFQLNRLMVSMLATDATRPPRRSPDALDTARMDYGPRDLSGPIHLFALAYREMNSYGYTAEVITNDSMSPVLDPGDIVLIDVCDEKIVTGIYQIKTVNGPVIAKVVNKGGRLIGSYVANERDTFEVNQEDSIGRVASVYKSVSIKNLRAYNSD